MSDFTDRKKSILETLDSGRARLEGVLARIRPDQWEMQFQDSEAQWTMRQALAHLVTAQRGMTAQIQGICQGQEGVPPDFDLNRWNRRSVEKSAAATPQDLIAALQADRATLMAFINGLTEADLHKTGRHGSLQIMSVEQILRLIGQHEALHADEMAAKLDA